MNGLWDPAGTEEEEPLLIEPSVLAALTAPVEEGTELFVSAAQYTTTPERSVKTGMIGCDSRVTERSTEVFWDFITSTRLINGARVKASVGARDGVKVGVDVGPFVGFNVGIDVGSDDNNEGADDGAEDRG